jgi:hypothetical protein
MDQKLQLSQPRKINKKLIRKRLSNLNANKPSKIAFKKEIGALARRTDNL